MAVILTSPVLGLNVGASYTGPEEDWLLAEGYARRDAYSGPGVLNTGPTDVVPAKDPQLAANREIAPKKYATAQNGQPAGGQDPGKLDPALFRTTTDDTEGEAYDFDQGGVNADAPGEFKVEPKTIPLAGRASTKIYGQNLTGVTGGTVGGTALTAVVVNSDGEVTATFPAKTAGSYSVVLTNPSGSKTETNAVTYA